MIAAGKIRSKSHIRSEGLTSQYSPCPKIPSATGDSKNENHYSMHIGLVNNNSVVPLTCSDEKASGRWSARHRGGLGSEGKMNKSREGNTRSFGKNEVDPYDRKSFDKSQTMHRSAIHTKTTGLIPKGPVANVYEL